MTGGGNQSHVCNTRSLPSHVEIIYWSTDNCASLPVISTTPGIPTLQPQNSLDVMDRRVASFPDLPSPFPGGEEPGNEAGRRADVNTDNHPSEICVR